MTYVGLWMEVPVKPGALDAVITKMHVALDHLTSDDGAVFFAANASAADPDVLFVYEVYRDQAAMDAHNAADWLSDYVASLGEYLAGSPSVRVVTPLLAKGM